MIHSHRTFVRPGELCREHRGFTEYGDAAFAGAHDGSLIPAVYWDARSVFCYLPGGGGHGGDDRWTEDQQRLDIAIGLKCRTCECGDRINLFGSSSTIHDRV